MPFNTHQTDQQIQKHRHSDLHNAEVHAYPQMPSLEAWKKDSFVGTIFSPRRADDRALVWIDQLVHALYRTQSGGESIYLMAELFFSTMWWLNNFRDNPKMDARRRPAILRLNLCAANQAAAFFGLGVGEVASRLKMFYGTGLNDHGIRADITTGANYLESRLREEYYRVFLRRGLAYQPVRREGTLTEEPLDSQGHLQDQREGFGYAMSVSGGLFAGDFGGFVKRLRLDYHSSFLAGEHVLCAGSIAARKGRITMINNCSGHYAPVDSALAQVLRRLMFARVDISKITVEFAAKVVELPDKTKTLVKRASVPGDKFLLANGNLSQVQRLWEEKEGFRHAA